MSVRILSEECGGRACMYCSTTDWAFGPVISYDDDHDAVERMELFIKWLKVDARSLPDNELAQKYSEFLSKEKEIWTEYEATLEREE